jgi:hypothetical protein
VPELEGYISSCMYESKQAEQVAQYDMWMIAVKKHQLHLLKKKLIFRGQLFDLHTLNASFSISFSVSLLGSVHQQNSSGAAFTYSTGILRLISQVARAQLEPQD